MAGYDSFDMVTHVAKRRLDYPETGQALTDPRTGNDAADTCTGGG